MDLVLKFAMMAAFLSVVWFSISAPALTSPWQRSTVGFMLAQASPGDGQTDPVHLEALRIARDAYSGKFRIPNCATLAQIPRLHSLDPALDDPKILATEEMIRVAMRRHLSEHHPAIVADKTKMARLVAQLDNYCAYDQHRKDSLNHAIDVSTARLRMDFVHD